MIPFPDTLGGRPAGDDWRIERHVAFTLEVPAPPLEARLPAGVSPVRPVPGMALLQLIVARYGAGTLGSPEPFDEVVCAALVEPDLSLDMPLPRLTLHVFDVLSNSARFVAHKVPALKMPVHHAPSLEVHHDADAYAVRVADAQGPMFELGSPDAAGFKHKAFVGQYFAQHEGALQHSVWAWEGTLFETQRRRGGHVALADHPWLASWEVGSLERLRRAPCFMRQHSEPSLPVAMRTYAPRCLSQS